MSVSGFTPKIRMTLGRVKGNKARQIKFAIYNSVIEALEKAVAKTVQHLLIILPESKFRVPPYPPSYKSERLAATAIHVLKRSLEDLKAKGFVVSTTLYELFLDFPASYTGWVNEMRGVRWSKPSTEEGFVQKSQTFLLQMINQELRNSIVRYNGEEIGLSKFISRVQGSPQN